MRKCYALLSILICLLCHPFRSLAQEIFGNPPARLITSFKFQLYSGGVVMIHGKLNDHGETLNFIFDTGSGGISLDSTTCAILGVKGKPSDRTIRGIGGVKKVSFLYDATLHLPGLTVDSLDFHINDYELLTSVYGEKIDGIIGYSFLSRYIVRLDYDSLRMFVYSPGEIRYRRGGHILRPAFANLPMQQIRFRDSESFAGRFYLDTGAGLCFLLNEDFARDSAVLHDRKRIVTTQAEGLGGKREMKLTTVRELRFGPYRFRNVPTYIFDDEFNVTSYPNLGGVIGNDLMRRFNVTLNYPKREIHIIPNSHFNDLFDYAYTGMAIYYVDGQILLEDVIKNSPADLAGFRPGDVILAINNNFSNNIQVYKTMLQSANEKLKIVVMRDGAPMAITLKPKNILR